MFKKTRKHWISIFHTRGVLKNRYAIPSKEKFTLKPFFSGRQKLGQSDMRYELWFSFIVYTAHTP